LLLPFFDSNIRSSNFFKVREIAGSKKDVRHYQLVGPDSTLHFDFR